MPSLKDLKGRINSVKKTQKITSAMKMVAAAKLRRAQDGAESARPYAQRMHRMVTSIAAAVGDPQGAPPMLVGTGKRDTILYIVCTADRGLCGAFNSSIVREMRRRLREHQRKNEAFKLICVGKKGRDLLHREFGNAIVEVYTDIGRKQVEFDEADQIARKVTELFEAGEFDVCTVVYNKFQSAMSQTVTPAQLIPFEQPESDEGEDEKKADGPKAVYIFEPEEEDILRELLPRNIATQIFQALLESSASEHGARMTAMDNATRNADEMIDNLTLVYNRQRQAMITKELIEIISGAEAL